MINDHHTILLVEDDPTTLALWAKLFSQQGFIVKQAASAIDAVAKLSTDIDLVLTDLDMPGLSGSDLGSIIKMKYHIPTIMITGLRDINPDHYQHIFNAVVFKPIRPASLLQTVNGFLSHFYGLAFSAFAR